MGRIGHAVAGYAGLPADQQRSTLGSALGLAATAGAIATAATLRNPSRPIALSMAQVARSWVLTFPGAVVGVLANMALNR